MKVIKATAEHKFFGLVVLYNPGGANELTASGSITSLSDIPQGLLDSNRIGDKVTCLSLELKIISVTSHAAVSRQDWGWRCLVFFWKEDTAPSTTDLFALPTTALAATEPGVWPLDHDKKVKRKLLYDKTFTQYCDNLSTTFTGCFNPYMVKQIFIPLSRKKGSKTIHYQNATTTGYNKLYIGLFSNATAGIESWFLAFTSRLNYIDV